MTKQKPIHKATDAEGVSDLPGPLSIGVVGCTGRVGTLIVEELLAGHHEGLTLAGGTVRKGYPTDQAEFFVTDEPDALFEVADAVIDFTTPEATRKHAWLAAKHHKPLIVGTTGLTQEDEQELQDAAKETQIVYAANMSVGVNMLLALVEQAASRLAEDWDIEIFEAHHKHKVDAPSGTALALGKSAAKGREKTLEELETYNRHGITGEREKGAIGFSVARGGNVVGEHDVTFYAEGERLQLSHKATDRGIFARGALRAAKWVADQPNGLYSMRDVLDL